MSLVNEQVVREYFEMHGYMVHQARKYAVLGRGKTPTEEIQMAVFNPQIREHRIPEELLWSGAHLRTVARAVVGVVGWHSERFYASRLAKDDAILGFVRPESLRYAASLLGCTEFAKIVCLPRLAASCELKEKAVKAMKAMGIDGIIPFGTILLELVGGLDVRRSYEKSVVLEVIRLMKSYHLLRSGQLELFRGPVRRR